MAELDQKQQQQAQFFWNAYSNIQAQVGPMGGYDYNRELLTYIQADQRYVSYTEAYADMRGITGTERERIVAEARETHQASSRTLDTSPTSSASPAAMARK